MKKMHSSYSLFSIAIPIFVLYSFISLIFFSFSHFCALIWLWLSGCCTDTRYALNVAYMFSHAHNSEHFNWNKKRFDDCTKDTLSFTKYIFSFALSLSVSLSIHCHQNFDFAHISKSHVSHHTLSSLTKFISFESKCISTPNLLRFCF